MKTKSEAATEYMHATIKGLMIDEDLTPLHIDLAFEAGVEFAQRWIPVSEELPNMGRWIIFKVGTYHGCVKIKKESDKKFLVDNWGLWRYVELE